MKKLVLAEKPSVGRELARVLGCRNCGKYFESSEYVVTWALGHLITPADPNFYGAQYRHWSLQSLPILPSKLENVIIEKTKEQYLIVEGLLNRDDVESVVIATDAGREGELVARWILQMAKCEKPLQRLWISSQTDAAITDGFNNLKPGSQYDNLFHAAYCRSAADWYVGYNASRAMSCYFDTPLSAGRVQTPTLALMVNRELEIQSFTGKFYWTLKADFGSFTASMFRENTIRIPSEEDANATEAKLTNAEGKITSLDEVHKEEKPPLAYDLTELQRDANTALGFSAKETLDILQRLYEVHKIVTYPRTDSRYITDDIVPTIPSRLAALANTPFGARALKLKTVGYNVDYGRFVDNEQVSDHHALLPTEEPVKLDKLSANERALWELIIMRFMEVLSPNYTYKTTTLKAEVEGETFVSRLSIPTSLGWREVGSDIHRASTCSIDDDDLSGRISLAANFKVGDTLSIKSIEKKRFSTPAPERYTEATLLYAMEHAKKFVDDSQQKKHLANGLGTPATRADIIEKLVGNHCIERKGRYLVPTAKGMELVRLVPEQLKSPELTAIWEERLSAISAGEESVEQFVSDVKANASSLVKQIVASSLKYNPSLMGEKLCPHCAWPMIDVEDEFGQVHHVCQRFSCGYEEKEVKKRVPIESTKPVKAEPVKITTKPLASTVTDPVTGKKRVVIRKAAINTVAKAEPEYTWKTEIEVVKESHYRPQRNNNRGNDNKTNFNRSNSNKPEFKKTDKAPFRKDNHERNTDRPSSTGGTFADFLLAQKQREERDRQKRKK